MDNFQSQSSGDGDDNKPGFFKWLRNRFFTGVVIAFPIAITLWLIQWFVRFVDGRVLSLVPPQWSPNLLLKELTGLSIPGTGIVMAFIALVILGMFASNIIGNSVLRVSERLLDRVPLVGNIYNAVKQIVTTVAAQKDQAFKEVCLIEYPKAGVWAIGFITSELRGSPAKRLGEGYACVFVPTTPNPTSGFLLFAKRDSLKILDMTPEEGAKMIISGGMVTSNEELQVITPGEFGDPTAIAGKKSK